MDDQKFEKVFWVFFAICGALGLALTGVVIWAIIALVSHFTA